MSLRSALVAVGVVAAVAAVSAQSAPPKPGPEHKRLEAFVGKWVGVGQAHASPYGPAGPVTSTDTYEWLPGGFFLVHHWDAKQGATVIRGMEVLGYDARAKAYTATFFDNAGNKGVAKGSVQGNVWTWTFDSEVAGKPLKERCIATVSSPDTIQGKCEQSADGVKWMPNLEIKGTKVK